MVTVQKKPIEDCQDYFQRLAFGHNRAPLAIDVMLPEKRWVSKDEQVEIKLHFDRLPKGPASLSLITENAQRTIPLQNQNGAYLCTLPIMNEAFDLQVHAEDMKSQKMHFKITPDPALRIQEIKVWDKQTKKETSYYNGKAPKFITEGSRLHFILELAEGPWQEIGFSSEKLGILPLKKKEENIYTTEIIFNKDDVFKTYWTLADGIIKEGPLLTLDCQKDAVPKIRISDPVANTEFNTQINRYQYSRQRRLRHRETMDRLYGLLPAGKDYNRSPEGQKPKENQPNCLIASHSYRGTPGTTAGHCCHRSGQFQLRKKSALRRPEYPSSRKETDQC